MASPVEQRVRTHESRIRAMFDAIAPDYDRLNHWLSFGQDLLWRLATARRARLADGEVALDVGTGAGDLALALLRASGPSSRVVGVDLAGGMVERPRRKAAPAGPGARLPGLPRGRLGI